MRKNPYAVASLILGLLSFINLFNIDKAVLAVVFGLMGIKRLNESDAAESGERMAYWGIALGIIYLIFLIYILFFYQGPLSGPS